MNGAGHHVGSFGSPITRRRLLAGTAGMAGLSLLGGGGRFAAAQELAGEIDVQFEARGGILETEATACIAEITGANAGAAITIAEPIAGNYPQKLILDLSSGQGPDVFSVNSIMIAQLGASGMVLPLDDYLAGWADWEQFIDPYKAHLAFGGQIFALPYAMDTHFLYYRTDLFAKAGLPVPWQPASLRDIADAALSLKAVLPAGGVPFVLYAGANASTSTAVRGFLPLLYASGGRLKNDDGKWIIDSPAIRSAMRFYEEMYRIQALVPETVLSTPGVANAMRREFAMGNAAILFDGSWIWDDITAVVPVEAVGYTLFPSDSGDPFTVGGYGNGWFINAACTSPDLAWAFISCMMAAGPVARLNLDDPHVPPRVDSGADPGFQEPFMAAMVDSIDAAVMASPEPEFAELVEVIQNATGKIASGEATADEVIEEYAGELRRVLGDDNVVEEAES